MDCLKYQYSFNVKALNDTISDNFLIKYQNSHQSTWYAPLRYEKRYLKLRDDMLRF